MDERFANNSDPTQSARNGFTVEPSDNDLPHLPRELLILEDGDLVFIWPGYRGAEVDPAHEDAVQSIPVVKGDRFPWAVRRILPDTTATVYAVY